MGGLATRHRREYWCTLQPRRTVTCQVVLSMVAVRQSWARRSPSVARRAGRPLLMQTGLIALMVSRRAAFTPSHRPELTILSRPHNEASVNWGNTLTPPSPRHWAAAFSSIRSTRLRSLYGNSMSICLAANLMNRDLWLG